MRHSSSWSVPELCGKTRDLSALRRLPRLRLGYRRNDPLTASVSMSTHTRPPRSPPDAASIVQASTSAALSRLKNMHVQLVQSTQMRLVFYRCTRRLPCRMPQLDTTSFRSRSPSLVSNLFLTGATSAANLGPYHGYAPVTLHTRLFNIVIR
ncbi:hypothetical protein C8R45DRAFT_597043 [Mycena sanguinolenta]|nr:hypothetical protein C8R45DRAFT_597043 [Mycena sanguinolenta]